MEILGYYFTNEELVDIGISLAIVLFTVILARLVLSFILDKIVKRFTGFTQSLLDDHIIEAVRPPLYWLVFILTFRFALDRLDFLVIDFDDLFFIIYTIIGFVVAWRLVNMLTIWFGEEVASKTGSALDNQLSPFLRRILLILVGIIAAIVVLGHFNVEVSGLVTTLGIGSLAIALAAQAALSDTISGFIIMFDRPFRIGDRIEIQDLDTWGDVVDIGLRSTRIRTRDNRMVIIPNSVIGKSLVVNHAYPDSQYRIQIEVGVAYGTDLEFARKTLVDAVTEVEGVLHERKVEALFLHFGDSALIFRVRWWLESYEDTRRMFDRVNTAIYNALNEAGIEMPNPQLDLHHKINAGDIPKFRKVFRSDK